MCGIDTVFSALTAIGTIAVAVVAVWGNWIRFRFAAPRIEIRPHNLRGTVTQFTGGSRVIYYHLKVANTRHWAVARSCRILLREIWRRGPDQQYHPVPLPVPVQFVWAPAQFAPIVTDISGDEQVFDFGRLIESGTRFEPVLYVTPNDFQGFVGANQAVRYRLEVVAEGLRVGASFVYEVAWNGSWSDNLDAMRQNLTIREVPRESPAV
jgi:hypothetical protein